MWGSVLTNPVLNKNRLIRWCLAENESGSCQDFFDWSTKIEVQSLSTWYLQLSGIQTKLMEHRRMQVGHVVSVFNRVEAEFISLSVRDPSFDSASG